MATGVPAGRSRPPAARAVVGLADGDAAAADMLAVHALDGVVHRLLVLELHPPEAAGPPRLRIHRHLQAKVKGLYSLVACIQSNEGACLETVADLQPTGVQKMKITADRHGIERENVQHTRYIS